MLYFDPPNAKALRHVVKAKLVTHAFVTHYVPLIAGAASRSYFVASLLLFPVRSANVPMRSHASKTSIGNGPAHLRHEPPHKFGAYPAHVSLALPYLRVGAFSPTARLSCRRQWTASLELHLTKHVFPLFPLLFPQLLPPSLPCRSPRTSPPLLFPLLPPPPSAPYPFAALPLFAGALARVYHSVAVGFHKATAPPAAQLSSLQVAKHALFSPRALCA
ncbi:hypothetical protein, conserved in T. vivax, partial [Trypanosoma vivax Y486]